MKVFTIGYEGATVDAFLAALTTAGVRQVADIRAIAASRRPGFAKTALAANLASVGIGYRHFRQLGTPKPGRDAARRGDRATLESVYDGQLQLPAAQAEIEALKAMLTESPTALLCFEDDPGMCHRSILIERELPDMVSVHLHAG